MKKDWIRRATESRDRGFDCGQEQILADIICESPRANESTLMAALDFAYKVLEECHQKGSGRSVHVCSMFGRKSQNSSSCKKLAPAVARLVQQLRDRHQRGKRLSFGSDNGPPLRRSKS